jgi:PAS domain S-box-containing protein
MTGVSTHWEHYLPELKRWFSFMIYSPCHGEVIIVTENITERKQAELALRDSEGRFRALVEQSLAGIYIIQDGCFRYVNPGFAAIFGYDSPAALIDSVPVTDLVDPEDLERVKENVRRRIDGEVACLHYSFAGLRRDGSRIDVEAQGRRFDYQGRPAIIGFILNITERKAVEEALRRQTQELAQRNEELERFNRATVGRELDMIALKQQVNALSRQLGQERIYPLVFLDAESAQE